MKYRLFVNKILSTGIICSSFSSFLVNADKTDDVKDFLYSVVDTAYVCSSLEVENKYREIVETRNDIYFSIFDGMIQQAEGMDELIAILLLLPSEITFEHKKIDKYYLDYLKKKRVAATVREQFSLEDFLIFFNNVLKDSTKESKLDSKIEEELGINLGIKENYTTLKVSDLLVLSKPAYGKIFTSIEDIVNRFILNDALKFLSFLKDNKKEDFENSGKINSLETKITNLRKNIKDMNSKYLSVDSKKDPSEFISDFSTLSKEIVNTVFDVANYSRKVEDYLKNCFEKANRNKLEQYKKYKIELSNFINKFQCFAKNRNFCEKCKIMKNLANETTELGIHWDKTPTALDNIQFCAQLVENIIKEEKNCKKFKNSIDEMKKYSEISFGNIVYKNLTK